MIGDLMSRRQEQLKLQEDIDKRLKQYASVCPKKVVFLLLQERKLNRELTNDFTKFDIFNILNQVKNNLDKFDSLYEKMQKFKC